MARDLIPYLVEGGDPREAAAQARSGLRVHYGGGRAPESRLDLVMVTLAEALDRITALEARVGLREETPRAEEADEDEDFADELAP